MHQNDVDGNKVKIKNRGITHIVLFYIFVIISQQFFFTFYTACPHSESHFREGDGSKPESPVPLFWPNQ